MNVQHHLNPGHSSEAAAISLLGRDPVPRLLVLGLGNDILTDDAIGLHISARLGRHLKGVAGITVTQTTQMGLALLDVVCGYEELILVDSVQTLQVPPGYLHVIADGAWTTSTMISPHFIGIGEMLALGRELGMPVPKHVTIFAIEVEDPFTVGTSLTPLLKLRLPAITRQILGHIQQARG